MFPKRRRVDEKQKIPMDEKSLVRLLCEESRLDRNNISILMRLAEKNKLFLAEPSRSKRILCSKLAEKFNMDITPNLDISDWLKEKDHVIKVLLDPLSQQLISSPMIDKDGISHEKMTLPAEPEIQPAQGLPEDEQFDYYHRFGQLWKNLTLERAISAYTLDKFGFEFPPTIMDQVRPQYQPHSSSSSLSSEEELVVIPLPLRQ